MPTCASILSGNTSSRCLLREKPKLIKKISIRVTIIVFQCDAHSPFMPRKAICCSVECIKERNPFLLTSSNENWRYKRQHKKMLSFIKAKNSFQKKRRENVPHIRLGSFDFQIQEKLSREKCQFEEKFSHLFLCLVIVGERKCKIYRLSVDFDMNDGVSSIGFYTRTIRIKGNEIFFHRILGECVWVCVSSYVLLLVLCHSSSIPSRENSKYCRSTNRKSPQTIFSSKHGHTKNKLCMFDEAKYLFLSEANGKSAWQNALDACVFVCAFAWMANSLAKEEEEEEK